MASAEAVLSSDPQRICPCGSSRCESVNDTVACCDCGRVLEDDFLVNYGCLASTGVGSIDNIVPEGCTGAHLTGASSLNRGRRAKVRRLQTQVSNHGRDLELSETAISKARDLIEDARTMDTTAETAVAAAALVLGARIEGFPVSMKTVCLRLEIPFSDFKASIASLQRRMQQPVPSVQVDEVLKCGICKFCSAWSLSKQVTNHLLPLAQRLLQFTRRYITPSAMLQHAAACAMLAIELVAEVSPSELVLDDLCIGANLTALKQSYCQPLYSAVHDMSVKHGVVVGPTGERGALVPVPTSSDALEDRCEICRPSRTRKRKRVAQETKSNKPHTSRVRGVTPTMLGITLHEVRTMLDIDECMAMEM